MTLRDGVPILPIDGQVIAGLLRVSGTVQGGGCNFVLKAFGEPRNDSLQVNVKFVAPCDENTLTVNPELNGVFFK